MAHLDNRIPRKAGKLRPYCHEGCTEKNIGKNGTLYTHHTRMTYIGVNQYTGHHEYECPVCNSQAERKQTYMYDGIEEVKPKRKQIQNNLSLLILFSSLFIILSLYIIFL